MKGNSLDSYQASFILTCSNEQLYPSHPFYQLNERINRSVIEEEYKKFNRHTGCSVMQVRLLVTPMVLKIVKNLSDEQETDIGLMFLSINIYRERHNFIETSVTCSDLTHFRTRNANKGKDHLLKMSIDPFNQMFQKKEVVRYKVLGKNRLSH